LLLGVEVVVLPVERVVFFTFFVPDGDLPSLDSEEEEDDGEEVRLRFVCRAGERSSGKCMEFSPVFNVVVNTIAGSVASAS